MRDYKRAGIRSEIGRALGAGATAGLAGLCLHGAALAQTAPPVAEDAAASAQPAQATADDVDQANPSDQVGAITVQAQRALSSKQTASPVDQSQTTTVVTAATIQAQNLLTLRDVLSTVPGITFGAGEGGSGYGDSINLRGYSANSDIQVDGVRDSAQYTRSDPFDLAQVEVTNGADSVYSGAGSVGGSINMVTKTPSLRNRTTVEGAAGTDSYARATLDANRALTDSIGVRLNAMVHQQDVPGRDVENFKRWGVAPSIGFGLGTDTPFTLSYFRQHDDNIPQFGVPYYNGGPVPGVDPSNYYGYRNLDKQLTDVNAATATLTHRFSDSLSVRNLARWQKVQATTIVDAPQGTFCLGDSLAPTAWFQTASSAAGNPVTTDVSGYKPCTTPGQWVLSGPHGQERASTNTLGYDQIDMTWKGATGSLDHTVVVGASISDETYHLDTIQLLRDANHQAFTLPNMSVYSPSNTYAGPINPTLASTGDGTLNNHAVYAFDTAKLGAHWLANLGVRYEEQSSTFASTSLAYSNANPSVVTTTAGAPFRNSAYLLSYRAGLVYKPVADASIYIAYGNSQTPSQASVNGGCSAATCSVDPEKAINYEIGAKWDVARISLTASVFRNDRQNYKVADLGDPDNPAGYNTLDGKARVQGVTLGASGRITDKWSVFANYTYLTSKVLQGASDFVAAAGQDWTKGDPLTQVPTNAASLWTTYDLTPAWQVGYGLTYQGSTYLSQHAGICILVGAPAVCPSTGAIYAGRTTLPLAKSDPYAVSRLMVSWKATRQLNLQLNVQNLFDKTYYTNIRNNGWANPAPGRSATLTAGYSF